MFYGSIFSDFLQINQCVLKLIDFVPKLSQLYATMTTQGKNKDPMPSILCQVKKKKHSKDTLKHFPSILRHMTI